MTTTWTTYSPVVKPSRKECLNADFTPCVTQALTSRSEAGCTADLMHYQQTSTSSRSPKGCQWRPPSANSVHDGWW
jgi:hypothetical protein